MKIKIVSCGFEVEAELYETETARKIFDSLPLKSIVKTWGEEIYFEIPVECKEENSKEEVEVGDLAYWLQGKCFCIFFGRTPASNNEKPRAASKVNVFGKINGNFKKLKEFEENKIIKVVQLK